MFPLKRRINTFSNSYTNKLNPSNGSVFFRMVYQ